MKSIVKHPSDGSKNGDVGHAWIYLEGTINGQRVYLEGGHSGELGEIDLKYFDGLMDLVIRGDPNPIRYFKKTLRDGFFQVGNGGHSPTSAASIPLRQEQFEKILEFIKNYPFERYSLTGNQCSTFVSQVAAIAGLHINCTHTISIEPVVCMRGDLISLWEDPSYQEILISSPDELEKSIKKAIRMGYAENALDWYRKTHPKSLFQQCNSCWTTIIRFPERLIKYITL